MAVAGDIVADIKSDLVINGTDYDAQILRNVQSCLRQFRGKRYWFLSAYTEALSTTANQIYVDMPADFSALDSVDIIINGSRFTQNSGLEILTFDNLRARWWMSNPINSGNPCACAIVERRLYLSHLPNGAFPLAIVYYKQDLTLPTANETSIWFDDGYDAVRTNAMFTFKRDAQGFTATEEDGQMAALALTNLDNTHLAKLVGY